MDLDINIFKSNREFFDDPLQLFLKYLFLWIWMKIILIQEFYDNPWKLDKD